MKTKKYFYLIIICLLCNNMTAQVATLNKKSEPITKSFNHNKLFHEFEVNLSENKFFLASTTTNNLDIKTSVYDESGSKISEFDDNGLTGEFVKITSEKGGKFTIKIEPYSIEETGGSYTLSVECLENIGKSEEQRIKQQMRFWDNRAKKDLSGLGIVILQNGKTVLKESYGKANLEYDIPLTKSSVYDIASLAKQFTGYAVATMVEQNKLSLDDKVSKYLPELSSLGSKIKISDLVYHTSGLRDIGELFDLGAFGSKLTAERALEIISYQNTLNFEPGTRHSYSNTGYVLLAIIVERIANTSIREWSKDNIFSPLQMNNSFVNNDPELIIKNRAVAYKYYGNKTLFQQDNGMALVGSSALYSSLDDIAHWLAFFQSKNTNDQNLFRTMTTKGKLKTGEEVNYGFGLSVSNYRGLPFISHSGSTPAGFNTLIGHFPEHNLSFAIFSNSSSINPIEIIGRDIVETYLSQYFERPTKKENTVEFDISSIQKFEGHFQFNPDMTVQFYIDNDKFLVNANKDIHQLERVDATHFLLQALDSKVEFIVDANGGVNQAIVTSGGNIIADMPRVSASNIESVKESLETKITKPNFNDIIGTYYSDELLLNINISVEKEQLILLTSKHGRVPIQYTNDNFFTGFGDLEFIYENGSNPKRFQLSRGERLRNVIFRKINI
ncbi:serine hydrolase domain-containing protein [Winogradskyella flava]|uniref:serine hydrolase domain-containing protein n=1 Tax=Winogradskyella flava TaxID=1884876 RepID=UPI002491EC1B|nr:serine hydrolase domain-containing protein [Winogradskyella flava]